MKQFGLVVLELLKYPAKAIFLFNMDSVVAVSRDFTGNQTTEVDITGFSCTFSIFSSAVMCVGGAVGVGECLLSVFFFQAIV